MVVISSQDTCLVCFERVPDIAVEVGLPGKQQAPAFGGHRGDPAYDVMGIGHELLVCKEVKQPAGGIIRAGGRRVAVRKEADGINVRLMASDGLSAHPLPDISELG